VGLEPLIEGGDRIGDLGETTLPPPAIVCQTVMRAATAATAAKKVAATAPKPTDTPWS
jgi:hypothetical protein